jgi:hypothetical protein
VAPASISDGAEVKVLGPHWIHDRSERHEWLFSASWNDHGAPPPNDPEFWNPKVRAPICFNPPAARTFVPIFLMKTKLVVAGKSKTEIVEATASARDKDELPSLERGAMCYMSSK